MDNNFDWFDMGGAILLTALAGLSACAITWQNTHDNARAAAVAHGAARWECEPDGTKHFVWNQPSTEVRDD